MRKLIFLCLLGSLLSACSLFTFHQLEIEQGNIITPAKVNRLHRGMTESQVKEIMGSPVLVNILNANRLLYVYTYQIGSSPRIEKHLILTFNRGMLEGIERAGI